MRRLVVPVFAEELFASVGIYGIFHRILVSFSDDGDREVMLFAIDGKRHGETAELYLVEILYKVSGVGVLGAYCKGWGVGIESLGVVDTLTFERDDCLSRYHLLLSTAHTLQERGDEWERAPERTGIGTLQLIDLHTCQRPPTTVRDSLLGIVAPDTRGSKITPMSAPLRGIAGRRAGRLRFSFYIVAVGRILVVVGAVRSTHLIPPAFRHPAVLILICIVSSGRFLRFDLTAIDKRRGKWFGSIFSIGRELQGRLATQEYPFPFLTVFSVSDQCNV